MDGLLWSDNNYCPVISLGVKNEISKQLQNNGCMLATMSHFCNTCSINDTKIE